MAALGGGNTPPFEGDRQRRGLLVDRADEDDPQGREGEPAGEGRAGGAGEVDLLFRQRLEDVGGRLGGRRAALAGGQGRVALPGELVEERGGDAGARIGLGSDEEDDGSRRAGTQSRAPTGPATRCVTGSP
jgi:hypothetical protein